MSTDASGANVSLAAAPLTAKIAPTEQQTSQSGVPKQIVNAQTVCNEKNEKGKLCNGHLKQLRTGGEEAEVHLRGDDVLFKCQTCGALYMGPPLGHVRDPRQQRFVQKELTALLQAAGGTLPAFRKSDTGAWVPTDVPAAHVPAKPAAPAKPAPGATPAAKTSAPAPKSAEPDDETVEQKRARRIAEANARKATAVPIPGAAGPIEGETPEQKIARLKGVVAEAKRRKEAAAAGGEDESTTAATAETPMPTAETPVRTTPTAASTSGLNSSPSADAHRPAAEAQAATGQASAVPLSPAAATASPAAGAETVADLAPEASTELTPGAPKNAAPKSATSGKGIPPPPPHLAAPPGETKEEKIARLQRVVDEAKARAGK